MIDKLSDVFDVTPVQHGAVATVPVVQASTVTDDSDVARSNIKALMTTTATALEHAMQVAIQSDSPRAYEVLANLINTAADLNTRLINIHEREKKLVVGTPDEPQVIKQNVTNNVVFSGTTAELNDLIMKRMNNESS